EHQETASPDVLIAAEDYALRAVVADALRTAGYLVQAVAELEDVAAAARRVRPAALLLNLECSESLQDEWRGIQAQFRWPDLSSKLSMVRAGAGEARARSVGSPFATSASSRWPAWAGGSSHVNSIGSAPGSRSLDRRAGGRGARRRVRLPARAAGRHGRPRDTRGHRRVNAARYGLRRVGRDADRQRLGWSLPRCLRPRLLRPPGGTTRLSHDREL